MGLSVSHRTYHVLALPQTLRAASSIMAGLSAQGAEVLSHPQFEKC